MSSKAIIASIVIGILLIYGVFCLMIMHSISGGDSLPNDHKFNGEIWKTGTIRQRGQMVNFLLDSIGITGKSKKALIELLGTPDGDWNIEDDQYCSRIHYPVDRGHMFNYDMIIFFDSSDHARDVLFDD